MKRFLSKVAYKAAFGSMEKEVDQYLRTVTPDIALHDLRNYLVQFRARSNGFKEDTLQEIFDACSEQDSPQEPYWTKESFRNHIAKTHPNSAIPDTAIDVLWSCFYYYAYHPFPRDCNDPAIAKLDRPAFDRAVTLLALQGTEVLGTLDCGWSHWAYIRDRPYPCRRDYDRILRSIGQLILEVHSQQDSTSAGSFQSVKGDMMDLVATAQPHLLKAIPGVRRLEPTALRLLEGVPWKYRVHSDSLAALVSLLGGLRLWDGTWGRRRFHYGSVESRSGTEMGDLLVRRLQVDEEGFVTTDSLVRGLDLLPNFELRFHHLWAVLFQPPPLPESQPLGDESLADSTISAVLRAALLLVPPADEDERRPLGRTSRAFWFKEIYQSSAAELESLSFTRLAQAIVEDDSPKPHLVLFFGDQQGQVPGVMGAYFPGPEREKAGEDEGMRKSGLGLCLPQLLFYLQPGFGVLRLRAGGEYRLPGQQDPVAEYWLGESEAGVGLRIDPRTGGQTAFVQRDQSVYKDVLGSGGDEAPGGIKASFTVSEMIVYRVEGGEDGWEE
ncbi:hypothetical protein BDW62DRAFT_199840 [Aspergillus aurantiobrunneus]